MNYLSPLQRIVDVRRPSFYGLYEPVLDRFYRYSGGSWSVVDNGALVVASREWRGAFGANGPDYIYSWRGTYGRAWDAFSSVGGSLARNVHSVSANIYQRGAVVATTPTPAGSGNVQVIGVGRAVSQGVPYIVAVVRRTAYDWFETLYCRQEAGGNWIELGTLATGHDPGSNQYLMPSRDWHFRGDGLQAEILREFSDQSDKSEALNSFEFWVERSRIDLTPIAHDQG